MQYEIHHVPKRLYSLSVTDVLEYFYYGGLIFTKLGMWERAIELLDNVSQVRDVVCYQADQPILLPKCITVPSTTASAIQVEAVKTRVLVQLLKDGKVRPGLSAAKPYALLTFHPASPTRQRLCRDTHLTR